jgi:hypothetical protein
MIRLELAHAFQALGVPGEDYHPANLWVQVSPDVRY